MILSQTLSSSSFFYFIFSQINHRHPQPSDPPLMFFHTRVLKRKCTGSVTSIFICNLPVAPKSTKDQSIVESVLETKIIRKLILSQRQVKSKKIERQRNLLLRHIIILSILVENWPTSPDSVYSRLYRDCLTVCPTKQSASEETC